MRVPLLDLKEQYLAIRDEIGVAIDEVLDSQRFIMGPQVKLLEEKIAAYTNSKHAISCASGSDALLLSLMACGIGRGDAVITTPYTFFATAGAISRLDAIPIFVDIDPKTYNIDPNRIEDAILGRGIYKDHHSSLITHHSSIKALIPVHLYGQMADMTAIMKIAREHNLIVIEDAAQAIGAESLGRRAGSIGDFGCFSFFPSKNLGCMGDGGMITTNDDASAEKLKVLRVHGSKPKYYHSMIGCNSRLDTIQASVLIVKLKKLDGWTKARQQNAAWYDKAFADAKLTDRHLITPYVVPGGRHIYNQYVICAKNRDGLMRHLKDAQIGTEIYYPVPLHLQECYKFLGYKEGDLPVSESAARETLAIPIYPGLSKDEMTFVVNTISDFYNRHEGTSKNYIMSRRARKIHVSGVSFTDEDT